MWLHRLFLALQYQIAVEKNNLAKKVATNYEVFAKELQIKKKKS